MPKEKSSTAILARILYLLLLLLLELGALLPLERELLLAAVVSVGCTGVTFRKLSGCILFFAFSHCSCFSLFRCSLWAPSKEPKNAPPSQRDFGMVPAYKQSKRGQQQTTRHSFYEQRKRAWQAPNPGKPQNCKTRGPEPQTHPPAQTPLPLWNLILINEDAECVHACFAWFAQRP